MDIETIGFPMYQEMGADAIIAVGGGSAMDSAKGIAMMGDSGKTIDELEKILFDLDPHVATPWHTFPMICIPTTFGTGDPECGYL